MPCAQFSPVRFFSEGQTTQVTHSRECKELLGMLQKNFQNFSDTSGPDAAGRRPCPGARSTEPTAERPRAGQHRAERPRPPAAGDLLGARRPGPFCPCPFWFFAWPGALCRTAASWPPVCLGHLGQAFKRDPKGQKEKAGTKGKRARGASCVPFLRGSKGAGF